MTQLAEVWEVEAILKWPALNYLWTNGMVMQHQFGTVDQLTIDYHLGSVFRFMEELLNREYGADLHEFLRTSLDAGVWRRCRYVKDKTTAKIERAEALVASGDATSGLLEAFSALEGATQAKAGAVHGSQARSTLDVLMKFGARLADVGRLIGIRSGRSQTCTASETLRFTPTRFHPRTGSRWRFKPPRSS